MDPDGDGILAARLSGQDVQKGETAMAQILGGLALAATHGLKPACAVVAMRTSGGAEYERRLDFTFIRDRIAAGGLQWVCFRGPDRVARDQLSAYSFYNFPRATNTDLYLCSLGTGDDARAIARGHTEALYGHRALHRARPQPTTQLARPWARHPGCIAETRTQIVQRAQLHGKWLAGRGVENSIPQTSRIFA